MLLLLLLFMHFKNLQLHEMTSLKSNSHASNGSWKDVTNQPSTLGWRNHDPSSTTQLFIQPYPGLYDSILPATRDNCYTDKPYPEEKKKKNRKGPVYILQGERSLGPRMPWTNGSWGKEIPGIGKSTCKQWKCKSWEKTLSRKDRAAVTGTWALWDLLYQP